MHFIVALIVGGIIGWLAGMVMRDQGGIIWNVLIGCLGSIIGRFLLGALSHNGRLTQHPLDPMTLIVAFAGAVILLAIYNLVKRGTVR
ncbi:GlsB/YeaQ/YmgE family stress response membrane protein [Sphingomonas sp.]|uniref:GlsB/YeaQ/YmgE family stress response membrane protein n=1 Tax=Sphingomonas sp. TaxID=28214 RepID=UPI0025F01610|nr:GlsB/YeaQ/YmgE family stress response membrane protein [Sphingomonas sp.]MBV9527332.1 GlsB/YeaQ/YmgE family stress response membrane protein [Sphingomonas sp.]